MKKRLLFGGISILFIFVISLYFYIAGDNNNDIFKSNENSSQILKANAITMMYETEYQSGEYQVSTDSVWLGDEYIFNETLSRCENGSTLNWDEENKRVLMHANTSDRCYVYFDKYSMPQITNVEATEVTSDSITVSVTANGGDGDIVSYHYSINNGEYISSNANNYTFGNLDAGTSYNINIYVTDSNGRKSNSNNTNFVTNVGFISFTVDGTTYSAELGMTWYEWVNSSYNDGSFATACNEASGTVFRGRYSGGNPVLDDENSEVNGNDVIVSNMIYAIGDRTAVIC